MKTKLTLFVAIIAVALFGMGCSSLDKGLVAYYPFNGNAKDESGNGNHGEVKGAKLAADRYGKDKKAYVFDGKDDYLAVFETTKNTDFNYSTLVTFTAWIHPADVAYESIYRKDHKVNFYIHSGMLYGEIFDRDNYKKGQCSTPLRRGLWQHISMVWDGNNWEAFINGLPKSTRTTELIHQNKGAIFPTKIGQSGGRDGEFFGKIDDIRIYKRALSTEEVKALYELEKPKIK